MSIKSKLAAASIAVALGMTPALVERIEGVEHSVYTDIAGVPTVCAGITGPDVIKGKVYTKSECDKLLMKHIKIASDYVDEKVTVDIPPSMRASLYSFTYNAGRTAFGTSSMLRDINAGRFRQACDRLYDWVYYTDRKTGKKLVSKGLKNRRAFEHEYCVRDLK